MPKNIIICSDGTGNSSIKGRGSNVHKLYEAIEKSDRQIAIYDDGVGTETLKPLRLLTGAFGIGVRSNVIQLYVELSRNYEAGDGIYLFGFSRGAYTVRLLCGLIAACGVLDRRKVEKEGLDLEDAADVAYRALNHPNRVPFQKVFPDYFRSHQRLLRRLFPPEETDGKKGRLAERFRKEFAVASPENIRFIGVWDTVAAVGFPVAGVTRLINILFYKNTFPNNVLDKKVKKACHALSIDDERRTFHPILWDESKEEDRAKPPEQRRIEQVWFPGVHANVGGGYPKQGLSLIALDWMMEKAGEAELRFIEQDRRLYRDRKDACDHLYDSRAGFAYYYRYHPRDIGRMWLAGGCEDPVRIHSSAIRRIRLGIRDYAPGNIPRKWEVADPEETAAEAAALPLPSATPVDGGEAVRCPLEEHSASVRIRRWSHYTFIAASALLLVLLATADSLLPPKATLPGVSGESPGQSIRSGALFRGLVSWMPPPLNALGNLDIGSTPMKARPLAEAAHAWLMAHAVILLFTLAGVAAFLHFLSGRIPRKLWLIRLVLVAELLDWAILAYLAAGMALESDVTAWVVFVFAAFVVGVGGYAFHSEAVKEGGASGYLGILIRTLVSLSVIVFLFLALVHPGWTSLKRYSFTCLESIGEHYVLILAVLAVLLVGSFLLDLLVRSRMRRAFYNHWRSHARAVGWDARRE